MPKGKAYSGFGNAKDGNVLCVPLTVGIHALYTISHYSEHIFKNFNAENV
jgi:hypothetical protein